MSDKEKREIQQMMLSMKPGQIYEFNKFPDETARYILWLIQNQKGCQFETNGTDSDKTTITKFRKIEPLI